MVLDLESKHSHSDDKMPKCPKCGYQATSINDRLLTAHNGMGECPKCGIIVKKYLSSSKKQNEDKAIQPTSNDESNTVVYTQEMEADLSGWPQAGIYIRVLSALHNGVRGFFFFLAFYFPISLILIVIAKFKISSVANVYDINPIVRSFNYWNNIVVFCIVTLIILYGLILRPVRDNSTWGQEACGLLIIDEDGQELNGSIRVILLRILGHFLTLASYGALFLLPFFRKDKKTIADILPSSRQIVDPEIEPSTGIKEFFTVLALYIVFNIFNQGMHNWVESQAAQKQQLEASEPA
ncbi:MAG TPA: hypothetical protein EYP90_13275, partial [Chromatiaceae bacterium]|nr:hypothetical protein [Chromatiaceae bacterium]